MINIPNYVIKNPTDLSCWRQVSVDVINLLLESLVQHFVRFVEDQHFDGPCPKHASSNHVKDAPGSAADNVLAIVQFSYVLAQIRASNTSVALHVHEIAQCQNDLLDLHCQLPGRGQAQDLGLSQGRVQRLQNCDRESGRFTGSGLRLSNHIAALDNGQDAPLLDCRRFLEAWLKKNKWSGGNFL